MKKLYFSVFIVLIFSFSAAITVEGLTFDYIQFFEMGEDSIEKPNRIYTDSFNISESRYIACELNVINEYYDMYDKQYKIVYKYYYPDGELFGEIDDNVNFLSDWSTAWYHNSWGFSEPGNWEGGEYTVKVYIDGSYFGEDKFKMINDEHFLDFTEIVFYEAGYNSIEESSREYKISFPQSEARYIWYEIRFDNYFYDIEGQQIEFNVKYFNTDNTLMGETPFDEYIPLDWYDGWVSFGYGYDEAGNWEKGRHKVEVYIGSEKVAESYFTID